MLQDEPRSADIVAEGSEEVVTLVLRKSDFIELLGGLGQIIQTNFISRVLKAVDMLKNLTDAEISEIANHMEVERFADGNVVMRQGEAGDKLYIIKDGEVVFNRRKEDAPVEEGTWGVCVVCVCVCV
jgi:CRP-like cAMP-binding protein